MHTWATTMEDGKNLESTIEESRGVEEAACTHGVVRNWRDPTLHSVSCKEVAYKPKMIKILNPKIIGMRNYYGLKNASNQLNKIDWYIIKKFTL